MKFKVLHGFLYQTPGNFEADFNEIIKREEEESGLKLSCSDEKAQRRVRTSLEEKYSKLSKATSVPPSTSATQTEVQQNQVEQQQNAMLTVECVVVCTMLNDFVTNTCTFCL